MKLKVYEENYLSFFPLYASTIDFNSPQPVTIRPCGYKMPQIFLVNSGEGIINIDNKSFILKADDLFYIDKNIPHSYYGTTESFSTSYLSFSGSGFEGIKNYYNLKNYGIYKNKNRGLFEAAIKNLYEMFDTIYEVSSLCSFTFSTVITYFEETCKREYTYLESIYNYIEKNYSNSITLDELLTVYPYSKTKLCREFKQKYGNTIFEEITKIRLRNARYLIKNFPHLSLKEISSSCGFNDLSYFCKMYKRMYNTTPKGRC